MNVLKVKIIDSEMTNWYANQIGQIFEVVKDQSTDYFLIPGGRTISKIHCKIVKKDLDFQVGDKVYCLVYGNGVIESSRNNSDFFIVNFNSGFDEMQYTAKGVLHDEIDGLKRTLYHGHDLKVSVKEKEPVRHKWVNIIFDPTRNNHVSTPKTYDSKEIAIEEMHRLMSEPWIYVDTIQLIPNHLKEK